MGNTRFYKLFGLLLVSALIVSSNLAVGIVTSGLDSVKGPRAADGSVNHKGESYGAEDTFNFTEFD